MKKMMKLTALMMTAAMVMTGCGDKTGGQGDISQGATTPNDNKVQQNVENNQEAEDPYSGLYDE